MKQSGIFHSIFPLILVTVLLISGCDNTNTTNPIPDDGMFGLPPLPEANFPCENGLANGEYPCQEIDLFARVSLEDLGAVKANDVWGWEDPQTGKEYALVGVYDGITFVDISNPNNPIVVGKLEESSLAAKSAPTNDEDAFPACNFGIGNEPAPKNVSQGATWRDVKVYNNHAFVVSDGQIHGMQVFDLTALRNYEDSTLTFTEDALYDRLGNAHNITINEQTGFAYASGVTTAELCGTRNGTGLHIIDIRNPKNPEFAGCFIDPETEVPNSVNVGIGYIHDTQCLNYEGPDAEHRDKEICVSSAEGAIVITDVSDKSNPMTISFKGQTDMQYSHQGWLTEDFNYFLMNDELDENNLGRNTRTYIWDVKDLDNPEFIGYYTHTTTTIDHNLYVKNDHVYQANYTSGLQVFELGDLSEAELNRVAFFDTQPADDSKNYRGAWSNYPFFRSGIVVVSDINDGLFILRPSF